MPDLNNTSIAPNDEAVSLAEIALAVLRHWRLVIVLPVTVAILAGIWSVTRDRQYLVTASLIQKGSDGRGTTDAVALAQQFGLNLGGDRSSESPMFFMDLLKSNALLRKAVESTYEVPREGRPWRGTLTQYWDIPVEASVPPWLRAVSRLREAVKPVVNRETGVLTFSVSTTHPALSEQIAIKLLELLNDFNLEARQGRALDEGRFIGGIVSEAAKELAAAEAALRDFLQRNRQYHSAPELVLEHDRLQRAVLMRQEMYTSSLRSREQARIDAIRDTPLFTVIDRPNDSAVPQSRGTITKVLSGFAVGLLLSLVMAVVMEFVKRQKTTNPDREELQRVFFHVLNDVRRPSRWVRRASTSNVASGD